MRVCVFERLTCLFFLPPTVSSGSLTSMLTRQQWPSCMCVYVRVCVCVCLQAKRLLFDSAVIGLTVIGGHSCAGC